MFAPRWFDSVVSRFGWTVRTVGRGRRRLTLRKWVKWPNVARNLTVLQLEDRTVPTAYTWTGAVNSTWENAANWSPATGFPLAGADTASILAGTGVTLGTSVAVGTVTATKAVTVSTGVTLTLTAASTLSGGLTLGANTTLSAGASVTLAGASTFGSNVNLSGAGVITTAGTVNQTGGVSVIGTGGVVNVGTYTLAASQLVTGSLGTFTNAAAGTLIVSTPGTPALAGSGTVTNLGGLTLTAVGGTTFGGGSTFVNGSTGTVTVGGGDLTITGTGQTHTGAFVVTAGRTLTFNGGSTTLAGTTASGAGVVSLGAGTVNVTGSVSFGNLQLNNNALTVNLSSGADLNTFGASSLWTSGATVTGAGTWTNAGTLDASPIGFATGTLSGTATLANRGTLTMQPAGNFVAAAGTTIRNLTGSLTIRSVNLNGSLVNAGALSQTAGMSLGTGATVTNTATGTYTLTGSGGGLTGDSSNSFANAGVLRRTGTGTMTVGVPLSNTGTVEATAGTLGLTGAVAQLPASTLTGGTWAASTGGDLSLPNTVATIGVGATVTADGAGSAISALGGLTALQGALTVRNGYTLSLGTASNLVNTGTLTLDGGTLTHSLEGTAFAPNFQQLSGTVTLASGGVLRGFKNQAYLGGAVRGTGTLRADNGAGTVTSNGATFAPGASPGVLTITGNYTQSSASTLEIEVQGTNPVTPDFDQLLVSGTATLAGTLQVTQLNGFILDRSEAVNFLTYASRVGDFTTFTFPQFAGAPLVLAVPGSTFYYLSGTAYIVRNTADSGAFSLRNQILIANTNPLSADTILFNIPGGGVQTLQPTVAALPTILGPVTLDATSQPGYAGSPLVELDGSLAGAAADGLGFINASSGSVVRGLVINRFSGYGVNLASSNNVLAGNWIGLDATGTQAKPNASGGVQVSASNNRIGTNADGVNDAAERNVISGNSQYGVVVDGGINTQIAGNYIGTNASGTGAVANAGDGVAMFFSTGVVIGTDGLHGANNFAQRNVISGNTGRGVVLQQANVVAGNYIGLAADGLAPLGNQYGVQVTGTGARLGTNSDGAGDADERNLISANSLDGVVIRNSTTTGAVVAGNWVGLKADGTAAGNGGAGVSVVAGAHDNTIGGTNVAQAQMFNLGATPGVVLIQFAGILTAPLAYLPTAAQMEAALNTLSSIGGVGGTVSVLQAGATYTVTFGGSLAFANNPLLLVTVGGIGRSVAVTVSPRFAGNVISGNAGSGVQLTDAATSGNKVYGNYIGTDPTGIASRPNDTGVHILSGASGTLVGDGTAGGRNLISGNTSRGVSVVGAAGTLIQGNWIGLQSNGTAALANAYGVLVTGGATGTVVGGLTGTVGSPAPGTGAGNVISGNTSWGVYLQAPATVQGNVIGLQADGVTKLAGPLAGTGFGSDTGGDNAVIGGPDVRARNVISGNYIAFYTGAQTGWQILNNYIGTDVSGTLDRSNGTSYLYGLTNLTLGAAGAGNVWVNSASYTIYGFGTGWTIKGNRFSTTADGTAALGGGDASALAIVRGSGFTVGGTGAGDGNQFATGLNFQNVSTGTVLGNTFGLDVTGTLLLAGTTYGVSLYRSGGFQIGDGTAAGRNVFVNTVAGYDGVAVGGFGADGTVVRGNYFGTNKSGTAALGSLSFGVGVRYGATNTLIDGNVIAKASAVGVSVDGSGTPDGVVAWVRGNGNLDNSGSGGTTGTQIGTVGYAAGLGGSPALSLRHSSDGYVVYENTPFNASAAGVTVAAWVRPVSLPGSFQYYLIAANGDTAGAVNYGLFLVNTGSGVRLRFAYRTAGGGLQFAETAYTPTVNAYTHLAATADGSSVRFYVGGLPLATVPITATPEAAYTSAPGDPSHPVEGRRRAGRRPVHLRRPTGRRDGRRPRADAGRDRPHLQLRRRHPRRQLDAEHHGDGQHHRPSGRRHDGRRANRRRHPDH